jgi:predicted DNA-binding transcriptional regulator AlpA
MQRPPRDVGDTGLDRPPGLMALIDKEQLAHRLQLRVGEVMSHAQRGGFPRPVAYFRGRILWEEDAIDRWLGEKGKSR